MDIKNELYGYINSSDNNGALLLTGTWGSGKTYLVKSMIKELNENNRDAVAMISLFGVNSVSILHERVRDGYLEFSSGLLSQKARKAYRFLKKVADASAKTTVAALPESAVASAIATGASSVMSFDPLSFIAVKNTVGLGERVRKFSIVFDDFERCTINIEDLMGAINEYSENRDIKTVLLADEEKIGAEKYAEFKEKLIARTIKMNVDYEGIVHSLLTGYRDEDKGYKTFLLEQERCLLAAFHHSGYNNLRIFKACLMDFKRVYTAWRNSAITMDEVEKVLYSFCAMEYEAKTGSYVKAGSGSYVISSLREKGERGDVESERIMAKYFPDTFKAVIPSLAQWAVDGDWEDERFVADLTQKFVREDASHEKKFLDYGFWDLQYEDINKGMPLVVERACEGDLSRDEMISLLQKTHALKVHEIPLPCEVDYQAIQTGFELRKNRIRKGEIEEPKRRKFAEHTSLDSEAVPLYKDIGALEGKMYAWGNRRLFMAYLSHEEKVSVYDLNRRGIDSFDDELLSLFVEEYRKAPNREKRELSWALLSVDFNNDEYSGAADKAVTRKNFKTLLAEIQQDISEETDLLTVAIAKSLEKLLREKVDKLEESEPSPQDSI